MKSFSVFGNLFTILNSLNMERKGGTPMLHPFYFAFIWFKVQGSGLSWRLRRLFLEDGILVSQPSPLGNAIKLSGRTFLAPHRGSSPKG